jgi:hypothetical protein
MKVIYLLKYKTGYIFRYITKSRRRLTTVCSVSIMTVLLVAVLTFGRSYSLNPAVTHSIYTIPDKTVFYVEIIDPKEVYQIFESSSFGKGIIDSQALQKLSGTPEFMKLSNLLYFIELKAKVVIGYSDLPSFFGGSVGFAKMEDGSFILVGKTNLKSRLGVSLVSAFKGDKVVIEPRVKTETRKLEGVTQDSYVDLFEEKQIPFANLTVTRINTQDGYLFLVMLGDYLFVSDSANTLNESIYIAEKPQTASLRSKKGMKEAVAAFESKGQIFIYADSKKSIAAPFLTAFSSGEGAALVLYTDSKMPVTGDIFSIEQTVSSKTSAQKGAEWERIIPGDSLFAVYTSSLGINSALERMNDLGESWKDLRVGSRDYFDNANIDRRAYFGERKGAALVLHSLELFNKKLYPQFSIGYTAEKKDELMLKSLFKLQGVLPLNFQGVNYFQGVSMNLFKGSPRFYVPAYYYDKAGVVSSSKLNLEKYISASKGNRPVIGDDSSFAALGEFASAPHHLVINIPRAIDALRNFYLYGGIRTGAYTKITVDRDIIPLTDPIKGFETLHIALGVDKVLTGKLVLTESKKVQ